MRQSRLLLTPAVLLLAASLVIPALGIPGFARSFARSFARTPQAAPLSALARMPVKEVTVFKDGHAFVLHEGAMATDATGNVMMDYLPAPVLGTFWAYSADRTVTLSAVVAGRRKVLVEETALNVAELLEANAGAEVILTEVGRGPDGKEIKYEGTIVGIPVKTRADSLPDKGDVILVKTSEGTRVVIVQNIKDVTFKNNYKPRLASEEFRDVLTLRLDWASRKPEARANVGLVYLQKGIRWIPSYKISLDGRGNANVKLQAILLNELTNLENVTAHLVIGVPSFAFKETLDPISLQREAARLSGYFQQNSDQRQMLTNAIATQTARMSERIAPQPVTPSAAPADLGPNIGDSGQSEDLFIFTVKNLSLEKGQRMTLPVAEYTMKYKDIYALELPFAPPADVRAGFGNEQQAEVARLLMSPKAQHKIRLTNTSNAPLTTAPALLVKDDRVLAQAMMTYTSPGASVDIDLTKAIDIQVSKSEQETSRTPNALRWNGDWYARVELKGSVKLTSYRRENSEVEVTRYLLGNAIGASNGGQIEKLNVLENDRYIPLGEYPMWWRWYSWPSWWHQLNGIGRVTWRVTLEPGKSLDLSYNWNYLWR